MVGGMHDELGPRSRILVTHLTVHVIYYVNRYVWLKLVFLLFSLFTEFN